MSDTQRSDTGGGAEAQQSDGGDYVLETTDLTKRFGAITANDRISLSVERGEIRGIIGPNGSGKSTFFNTVTGFYEPDGGTVRFDGTDVTNAAPHEIAQQGMVRTFQIVHPLKEMTVRENLLAVYTGGIRIPQVKRDRADEVLNLIGLSHVAENDAQDLSGGQQKLLEFGRVLMHDPDLVLLDEPVAGVNPALEQKLVEYIKQQNDEGVSFIVVEHDMEIMQQLADTVTVFNQGSVIAEGTFDAVKNDPNVRAAYLGDADRGDATDESSTDRTGDSGDGGSARIAGRSQAIDDIEVGASSSNAHLAATDVVTGYGQHQIVNGVSVQSHDGVTCIFGPNGSGKSTLMKVLAGILPAWEGTLTYGDKDVTGATPAALVDRGVVALPQGGGIFTSMTVEENLQLGGYTVDRSERRDRMAEVLDLFPILEEKYQTKGRMLSGGQQMMLNFGRALVTGADVLLLDEPSAGLDPQKVDDVLEMITRLVDHGVQVVLVEQNVRAAMGVADHVYILAQGSLQFDGAPDDLSDEDELIDMYLGI